MVCASMGKAHLQVIDYYKYMLFNCFLLFNAADSRE